MAGRVAQSDSPWALEAFGRCPSFADHQGAAERVKGTKAGRKLDATEILSAGRKLAGTAKDHVHVVVPKPACTSLLREVDPKLSDELQVQVSQEVNELLEELHIGSGSTGGGPAPASASAAGGYRSQADAERQLKEALGMTDDDINYHPLVRKLRQQVEERMARAAERTASVEESPTPSAGAAKPRHSLPRRGPSLLHPLHHHASACGSGAYSDANSVCSSGGLSPRNSCGSITGGMVVGAGGGSGGITARLSCSSDLASLSRSGSFSLAHGGAAGGGGSPRDSSAGGASGEAVPAAVMLMQHQHQQLRRGPQRHSSFDPAALRGGSAAGSGLRRAVRREQSRSRLNAAISDALAAVGGGAQQQPLLPQWRPSEFGDEEGDDDDDDDEAFFSGKPEQQQQQQQQQQQPKPGDAQLTAARARRAMLLRTPAGSTSGINTYDSPLGAAASAPAALIFSSAAAAAPGQRHPAAFGGISNGGGASSEADCGSSVSYSGTAGAAGGFEPSGIVDFAMPSPRRAPTYGRRSQQHAL